jgi:hypothetical protein
MTARFEVFLPALKKSDANLTVRVEAGNWVEALKSALKKTRVPKVTDLRVEAEDDTVQATDVATGRIFRIREIMPAPRTEPEVLSEEATEIDTARLRTKPRKRRAGEHEEQWRCIFAVHDEAAQIIANQRGPYPFDEDGRDRLIDSLRAAVAGVDALVDQGAVDPSEARLLQKSLAQQVKDIGQFRTTERMQATCYQPVAFDPVRPAVARLLERLPLLEKAAMAQALHPEVLAKVLAAVEEDVAAVSADNVLKLAQHGEVPLDQEEKAQAALLRQKVLRTIDKLRARLGASH